MNYTNCLGNPIIIIMILALIYLLYKDRFNSLEKLSNTNDIKKQIADIYQADIGSIRNLSEVAIKLQNGGLTIPGNLTIKGSFNYLPKGSIIAFNGASAPSGWALCDGQNGTPDL